MGILNYTKCNGKNLLKCFCSAKCSKKKQKNTLPPPHVYPQQQSQVPEERRKKKSSFWKKKKKKGKGNKHRTNVNNTIIINGMYVFN